MQKGYTLRGAAKASGLPISTFHWCKKHGIVNPDVADDKGNLTLYSETQVEKAKAYRVTNQKPKKKSEDEIMDSLFGGAFDASIQNPKPQKDEVIIIPDAPIQNSDTSNQNDSEDLTAPAELIPPSATVDSDTQADKKITLATADQSTASEKNIDQILPVKDNKFGNIPQGLATFPVEFLPLKRFFAINYKTEKNTGWNNPEYQQFAVDVIGRKKFIAFDISSHGIRDDYALLDFDHVLNAETSEFINADAEKWFNYIQSSFDGYAELSVSGTGIHIFAKPDKFSEIGKKQLIFDKEKDIKLEIFYKNKSRFCLMTGNLFRTESREIAQGEIADDVLNNILAAIEPTSIQSARADENRPELPADVKALVDAINAIEPQELMTKGYLKRSEKGAPHPTGYICPWCGSGTHIKRTGALTFYAAPNPHFACHACDKGGDIIKYLSKIYGIDNRGKEFFTLIRKAADDFNIPYDPKIFEYNAPMNDDQDETIYLRDCIKDAPINLRVPSNFVVSEKCILAKVKSKKDTEEFRFIPVAQMPIIPTRIFREPSKNFTQYEVQMKIRGHWRTVEIDGAALADARDLAKTLASRGALIDEPTRLRTFFNTIIARNYDMPEIRAFNKPGWQKDGTFIYPTGGDNYICRRNNIDYDELFATKGDAEAWKKKFQDIIRRGGFLHRMIIGMNACAPLLDILELPNFSVHIEGTSNYAKSPLVKFGLSIYGNPTEGQLFRTWDGTAKNRLTMAAGLNDFPQALDEAESMSKRDEEEFAKNVYDFCGGIINQANKRNGDVRQAEKFRGIRISTGERPVLKITDKKGAFKRLITLHVDQPLFSDSEAVDLHRFCARNHGHFGRKWIEYISTHREQIKNDFDIALAKIQDSDIAKGIEETHVRALTACAVALWHFQILLNFEQSFDLYLATADVRLTLRGLPTKDEISDLTRGITLLAAWVTEHPKNFVYETPSEDMPAISFAESSGKVFRDTRVGFSVNAFRRIVEDELHLPSYEKFLNDLYDADKIICKSKREKAKQVKIDKQNVRLYLFKAGVLLSEENDEDEEQEEKA